MIYTKSQTAQMVASGAHIETFQHATLGTFDVSLTRKIIARFPSRFPVGWAWFEDMRADGHPELIGPEVMVWIFSQREICPIRRDELTEEQLNDPAINLIDDQGGSYIIDGIHRIAARFKRGYPNFSLYSMPLKIAPRVPEGFEDFKVQWGEMEVRDGQLVKRR